MSEKISDEIHTSAKTSFLILSIRIPKLTPQFRSAHFSRTRITRVLLNFGRPFFSIEECGESQLEPQASLPLSAQPKCTWSPNLLFLRSQFHLLASVFDIEKPRSNYIRDHRSKTKDQTTIPPSPLRSVDRLQQHEAELDAAAPAERHPATILY